MPDFWPWGIAATCFAVAIAATVKAADSIRMLANTQEDLKVARAEISSLKKAMNEKKETVSDEFTKRLNYPKV